MKNRIIQIILLSVLSLYLFYGFDIDKIDFDKFSISGIVITFILMFIAQLVLSLRWMQMSDLSFKISFETIIISSALNMILPAKLGELSKAFYLKKFYKYNYNKTLSLIFVERFFDIVMLFILLCIWGYEYATSDVMKSSILFLGITIICTIFLFYTAKTLFVLKKIPWQFLRVYLQKIYKAVHKIFLSPLTISAYTLLLWTLYFFATFTLFNYGVAFDLTISTMLGLFIFSTIAMSLPLAPAGIGTYEAAVVFYLSAYGVSKEDALFAATLYHILAFGIDFLLLYLFLFFKDIKFQELVK